MDPFVSNVDVPKTEPVLLVLCVDAPNRDGAFVEGVVPKSCAEGLVCTDPNRGCVLLVTDVLGVPNKLMATDVVGVPKICCGLEDGAWNNGVVMVFA